MTCITTVLYLLVDNDNPIEWGPVVNVSGEFVNNGAASMKLWTIDDVPVAVSGDITVAYVTDSQAIYRGVLQSTLAITAGTEYDLILTASVSGDAQTKIKRRCLALERTA